MSIASVAGFVEVLRSGPLLKPAQAEELAQLQARCPDPRALARELIQRGWLTPFQVNQILQGRAADLVLGPYVLLERLGEGGMGAVFKARHSLMNRLVAIKVIRKERLGAPDAVRRFYREVQAVGQLSHPNIVIAYDAAQVGDTHLFAMEYVEGMDLAKLVRQKGMLPVGEACEYIRQAALGLQHAHEHGLVHRDIKPANLLVTARGGMVKVLDMGLARLQEGGDDERTQLTQEGSVMGTPDFIAPEQAMDSHKVDIRSDIYSLGCSLYFLLSRRVPFPGDTLTQKLIKHQLHEPPPIEQFRPDLPPALVAVVRKMMAKRPADRYQTPAEAAGALAPFCLSGETTLPQAVPIPSTVPMTIPVAVPAAVHTLSGQTTMPLPAGLPPPLPRGAGAARGKRWLLPAAGGAGLLVLVVVLVIVLAGRGGKPDEGKTPGTVNLPQLGNNSLDMRFALIQPGKFEMGSLESEAGHEPHEGPPHEVTITRPFYLGIHPVTQAQFQKVMGKNPSCFYNVEGGGADHPVETVTWDEAVEFCRKLSELEPEKAARRSYRLPTEAEWEYACRAGSGTAYCFGNDPTLLGQYAWYKDNANSQTHPVGRLRPNAWGLYDMHGNVMEWCQDGYAEDYYKGSPKVDPPGPADKERKVLRGGSWLMADRWCRSAHRDWFDHTNRSYQVGFRVVLIIPADQQAPALGGGP